LIQPFSCPHYFFGHCSFRFDNQHFITKEESFGPDLPSNPRFVPLRAGAGGFSPLASYCIIDLKRWGGIIKRMADWLGKMSVAALAIGLFQNNALAVAFGVAAIAACLAMTRWLEGGKQ
jgi:hypothetical protein